MATIITSHIATNRTPVPTQVSPGIDIQTIPPAMERHQWTVAAALARNSSPPAARSPSVLVAVGGAHPALRVVGLFLGALGRRGEHVVGAVPRVAAGGRGR